jgi:hypothetical protein
MIKMTAPYNALDPTRTYEECSMGIVYSGKEWLEWIEDCTNDAIDSLTDITDQLASGELELYEGEYEGYDFMMARKPKPKRKPKK